jgi:VWFA-related protein
MTRATIAFAVTLGLLAWAAPRPAAQQRPSTFRANVVLVSVDVIVRDRDGHIVRDLTPADFEVREDGRAQDIRTFSFQEISDAAPALDRLEVLAGVAEAVEEGTTVVPLASTDLAGRRLVVLLFDTSSMEPEDVQRSVDSAREYVEAQMSAADLIAVATVGSTLNVITDFTSDRRAVAEGLATLGWTEGTATLPPDATTMADDEAAAAGAEEETTEEPGELDVFNNDVRLRVLRTLAESLTHIEQKKAVVYFSAGMARGGSDNQIELRAAINAMVRGNVSVYAIDTRGLQAVVPGGSASGSGGGGGGGRGGRGGRGGGRGAFSGRGVAQQFASLASSQDTLHTLASDTGGRAFTDTNDFGEAFDRLRQDMSAYYLLGYSSANEARDGRFRRIRVFVRDRDDLRLEARAGYYADRDFAHTSRGDRESQMEEQLYAAMSATDLPVIVKASYFRLADDRYYVPVALIVPGHAVPVPEGRDRAILDILGEVRDERGFAVGRIRQTMELPREESGGLLAARQVLYQSGVTLPPGRFSVKVVVRENANGAMGSFEAAITVPQLADAPLKVSSVVLSTQLQPGVKANRDNPLIRDGVHLLPNLTHVVGRDQKLFFYYEVYDPTAGPDGSEIQTSLAFYRGKVKVMETPAVVRTTLDAPDRQAALFQFEVAAERFEPGLYTCQVNIIDQVGGQFAFPRLDLYVR